jgi:hypothetical protein
LDLAMPARVIDHEGRYLTIERGPLVLAVSSRFNPGVPADRVSPVVEPDGAMLLKPVALKDSAGNATVGFAGEAFAIVEEAGKTLKKKIPVTLVSYAEAGLGPDDAYAVKFPPADRLR